MKNHNYLKQILKASARDYSKRTEAARLEREKSGRAGIAERPEETDPEIPRLVSASLFGRTEAERQAAKEKLAALGVKP